MTHRQAAGLAVPAGLYSCQAPSALMPVGVESWSVINDQDAVARSGKLFGMFKRAGERIFLNQKGDMLVCPGFLEAALWRKLRHTSVRNHLLAAYLKVRVQQLFACYSVMTAGLWAAEVSAEVSSWAQWQPQTCIMLNVDMEY